MSDSQLTDHPSTALQTWSVYRHDDNGSRFVVESHLTHETAQAMVAEFQARRHKQCCCATADPPPRRD
jgi:hypothetical protein